MAGGFPRQVAKMVELLSRLPGVGPKSATRMALYLLQTPKSFVEEMAVGMQELKSQVKQCTVCFQLCEGERCEICLDSSRKQNLLCVVERPVDAVAIEQTGSFRGLYHVLGGALNPLEHVSPEDLKISELVDRLKRILEEQKEGQVEVILATNPTMEGETTALYVKKKLEELGERLVISRIGSGLPMGADLEFADVATVNMALSGRRVW